MAQFLSPCHLNKLVSKYNSNVPYTGKALSEALIFASSNPQYDDILFIKLQVQYVKIPSSEHGENMLCTQIVFLFLFSRSEQLM